MKRMITPMVSVVLCVLISAAPRVSVAAPDLMVYPTRVVLGEKARSAQVEIINTSQTQASYKIGLVRKRMNETGELKEVTEADGGERFADDFIKYSPRQVTLLPGAGQTVRILFKPTANMSAGEYRSHLVFSKIPSGVTQVPDLHNVEPGTLSMKITANIGISIPVIARFGQLEAQAAIDPGSVTLVTAEPEKQQIAFTISRTGTRSVYGDIAVYRGKEKVAASEGLAVYTPNTVRKVRMHILDPYQLKAGDTVLVVFTEKGDPKPLAQATAVLR